MDVYSEQFGRMFRLMPNSSENFSWSLEDLFGPESAPLSIQIPLTIVYVITFMTGITGNVLTMIIFTTVPSLRNPTNFYLLSLAFSDLLMLVINLPVDMTEQLFQKSWVLGDTVCRSHVFMNELCYSATVMSICTLSIERYIAICHPLQAKTLVTKERTMTAIVAVWLLSIAFSLPVSLWIQEVSFRLPSGESVWAKCTIPLQYQEQVQYFTAVATVVFFVVPMCLLAGLYLLIGVKLHKTRSNPKSRRAGKLGRRADALINKTRGQAVKKLGLVVLAFAVCWTPYHALRLMYVYADMFGSTAKVVYLNMDYVSTVLLYLNSALNPVLYNLASKRFRHEFRVLLCKNRFKKSGLGARSYHRSDISSAHKTSTTATVLSNGPMRGASTDNRIGSLDRISEEKSSQLAKNEYPLEEIRENEISMSPVFESLSPSPPWNRTPDVSSIEVRMPETNNGIVVVHDCPREPPESPAAENTNPPASKASCRRKHKGLMGLEIEDVAPNFELHINRRNETTYL
ncbi:NMUR2 [Branchiostoma lanceolatum]|uniref:NMUR2 protein n=1 Tax=Branchiostoma lanceolatum TaxID=7740 RepID=A0A8J9ZIC9_BRALA|nr:NMUR2 [Branchiostoma lanceolatum]